MCDLKGGIVQRNELLVIMSGQRVLTLEGLWEVSNTYLLHMLNINEWVRPVSVKLLEHDLTH